MADISYVPGPLTAVVDEACWLLVEASPDSPLVTGLWQRFAQGAAADALLAGLLADNSGGVPGFALLTAGADGQHRLFCRGAVGATVATPTASDRIDGTGLLTWREHVLDGAERVFLGDPPADTALRLPATSGVLLAGCVVIDFTNFAARETLSYQPPVSVDRPTKTITAIPDTVTVQPPDGDVGWAPAPVDVGPVPVPVPVPAPVGTGQARPEGLGPGTVSVTDNDGVPDNDGKYDFLWGSTQIRAVEDAAVRGPGDSGPENSGPENSGPGGGNPGGSGPGDGGPLTSAQFANDRAPIASGPWAGGPPGEPPPGPPFPAGGPVPGPPGGLIDVPQWLAGPDDTGSGPTMKRGDLPQSVAGTPPPDRIGPVVPALICQHGHLNPPSGAACRRCGAPLPPDPVPVPRPVLGVLRLSLGDVITLDRDVVMGRNPRTDFTGADGEERPHVVKLTNTGGDVSRTHLRVTLDGWHVLVTDLNSTNGTMVTLPGRDPQQLRPADPMLIQPGTVVTLAEGIDFRYEVTD